MGEMKDETAPRLPAEVVWRTLEHGARDLVTAADECRSAAEGVDAAEQALARAKERCEKSNKAYSAALALLRGAATGATAP